MKRYCLVGTGDRGIGMYAVPMVRDYGSTAKLTGLCDVNPGRLQRAVDQIGAPIATFTDFDEMMRTVPCDVVIVTTADAFHDEYIVKAMEYGKDVITEKPMTVNAQKCRSILEAERRTGRKIRVTFNARYTPYRTRIKQLLAEGIVGDIHSVEFKWHLDTVHGADYFRRWHRNKNTSGGLLVHKSTHHFDLINWWLDMDPVEVAAMGSRHYYVSENKPGHGERCRTCSLTDRCEFYLDISHGHLNALYLEQEHFDGYYRDQCVFSDNIDIEDTMSVLVRYPKAVQLTYALTAATSFEGWQMAVNGSKGRLEAFEPDAFVQDENVWTLSERSGRRRAINWRTAGDSTGVTTEKPVATEQNDDALEIRVYPLFGGATTFKVPREAGDHGGADRRLRDDLFLEREVHDPFGHKAGSRAGAMSIIIGIAANQSIAERRFVSIDDLLGS